MWSISRTIILPAHDYHDVGGDHEGHDTVDDINPALSKNKEYHIIPIV